MRIQWDMDDSIMAYLGLRRGYTLGQLRGILVYLGKVVIHAILLYYIYI